MPLISEAGSHCSSGVPHTSKGEALLDRSPPPPSGTRSPGPLSSSCCGRRLARGVEGRSGNCCWAGLPLLDRCCRRQGIGLPVWASLERSSCGSEGGAGMGGGQEGMPLVLGLCFRDEPALRGGVSPPEDGFSPPGDDGGHRLLFRRQLSLCHSGLASSVMLLLLSALLRGL